jgi:hypothetical protein
MTRDNKTNRTIHEGHNVKRFRKMLGNKMRLLILLMKAHK